MDVGHYKGQMFKWLLRTYDDQWLFSVVVVCNGSCVVMVSGSCNWCLSEMVIGDLQKWSMVVGVGNGHCNWLLSLEVLVVKASGNSHWWSMVFLEGGSWGRLLIMVSGSCNSVFQWWSLADVIGWQ